MNDVESNVIVAWAGKGFRLERKCRSCRKPITLVMTTRGKWMPFRQHPTVLHTERDDDGRVFEHLARVDLHFGACAGRQQRSVEAHA